MDTLPHSGRMWDKGLGMGDRTRIFTQNSEPRNLKLENKFSSEAGGGRNWLVKIRLNTWVLSLHIPSRGYPRVTLSETWLRGGGETQLWVGIDLEFHSHGNARRTTRNLGYIHCCVPHSQHRMGCRAGDSRNITSLLNARTQWSIDENESVFPPNALR